MSAGEHRPSADEIRADIERTRERLGDTVEALGAHLNPSLLKARVKESVHEATIGRAKTMARNVRDKAEESGRGLIATIRENPLPVAMIAGGIGWLLFSKRRQAEPVRQDLGEEDEIFTGLEVGGPEAVVPGVPAQPESRRERIMHAGEHVVDGARSAGEHVVSGARSAGEHVVSGARIATSKVASGARTAGERVAATTSQLAHGVADRARAGRERVEESFDSNPMVLGAVAAAVGLAVGMTLPVSEREAQLMGGKRDELMDKAREAIGETREKVISAAERVVPEVKQTLKEVAREEGLAGA